VAAAAAAAAWPIAWPLAEVALLAAKSGDDIEATVQLKEPIQVRRCSARCGWAPLRSLRFVHSRPCCGGRRLKP